MILQSSPELSSKYIYLLLAISFIAFFYFFVLEYKLGQTIGMMLLKLEVKSKENNIGKVLYDENMYDDLVTIISQLKELTEILVQQLKNEGVKVDADVF